MDLSEYMDPPAPDRTQYQTSFWYLNGKCVAKQTRADAGDGPVRMVTAERFTDEELSELAWDCGVDEDAYQAALSAWQDSTSYVKERLELALLADLRIDPSHNKARVMLDIAWSWTTNCTDMVRLATEMAGLLRGTGRGF